MSKREDMIGFTIRIPRQLEGQIQARADIMRRSRNAEIIVLLERAVDAETSTDAKIAEELRERT